MTKAKRWIREHIVQLWNDDDMSIELPIMFDDGSSVIQHENGVAVIDTTEHCTEEERGKWRLKSLNLL